MIIGHAGKVQEVTDLGPQLTLQRFSFHRSTGSLEIRAALFLVIP